MQNLLDGHAGQVENRWLAAVHSLLEALDGAHDRPRVEQAIRSWAITHVAATELMIALRSRDSIGCAGIEERATATGGSVLIVPAPSHEPAVLTITSSLPLDRISDTLRRTLVLVGRISGAALGHVHRREGVDPVTAILERAPEENGPLFPGASKHAQHLANLVPRLAQSDVSVLIEGETGVGKTFVAQLIHAAGPRARAPLRIVNCSAIPETLLESQLFGHERGAFTGASVARVGILEAAGTGTILLDEIGELSLASQAKLLHVLEDRRFERIGSHRTIELRARVLCATNRKLEDMVLAGQFRKDLLFRISVVRLNVPPLRERGEDLLELAQRILAEAMPSATRRVLGFSHEALEVIRTYAWPGNVRELRNAIEHALALGDSPLILPEDFPAGIGPRSPQPEDPDLVRLPSALAVLERRAIDASLRATRGNRLRAAQLLGVTRQTLYNKLRMHKL
jgi:DNA-binding NtrC family response regulator